MDRQRMLCAAERLLRQWQQGQQVVAVVSAQGHTTDALAAQVEPLGSAAAGRELAAYLATGEQLCAAEMAMTLRHLGADAVSLTGFQAGIRTDSHHTDARILDVDTARLRRELAAGRIAVVAGFQGMDSRGDITTLGRGGSDTTAVALAAYLGADICRIYTDVDGVYDRDPRLFPDAKRFRRISYEQMLALARDGAQVLHGRCVELAREHGVRIQVLSSFRPGEGTLVADLSE